MNTRPKILVGSDNFKNLVLKSDLFVDKTLFIKDVIDSPADVLLITRPRRWGKSMNMSMLRHFLEVEMDASTGGLIPANQSVNRKLFMGGEVASDFDTHTLKPLNIALDSAIMQRQGKFPIILISFKEAKGNTYEEIVGAIRLLIQGIFAEHRYLLRSDSIEEPEKELLQQYISNIDINTIKFSLKFLSQLLHKHFGRKAWILIDEYDTPINYVYTKFGHKSDELEQVLLLFRGILGSALKSNDHLEKGVITGILRIAKANLFSDLNNISENTILDDTFAKYYGFTQAEVDILLAAYPDVDPETIKRWYNGYTFGGEVLYNPWSIAQCLNRNGALDTYWVDSGGTSLVDKALVSDEAQEDMQTLLKGDSITLPIAKQISLDNLTQPQGFFSLLLFAGYLNPRLVNFEDSLYAVSIPNQEVRTIYKLRVMDWLVDKLKTDKVAYYHFAVRLAQNRPEDFHESLKGFLLNATSFLQTGPKKAELFYSGFMLCLINTLASTHQIESEQESGDGRVDAMLIPKQGGLNDLAIIIEYKIADRAEALAKKATEALVQIQQRNYVVKAKTYPQVVKILSIGLAFCGKDVAMEYALEDNRL